jgi:hypothetical protein
VTFTANGSPIPGCTGLALSPGHGDFEADCSTAILAAGDHEVAGTYSGDTDYAGGTTGPTAVAIAKGPTVLVAAPAKNIGLATHVLSATLTLSATGLPVNGALVDFRSGRRTVCDGVTNGSGVASCRDTNQIVIGIDPVYTATYGGDANHLGSSGKGKL